LFLMIEEFDGSFLIGITFIGNILLLSATIYFEIHATFWEITGTHTTTLYSAVFLQRQKRIVNYYVKKLVKESQ
jgi:hypothetical protein